MNRVLKKIVIKEDRYSMIARIKRAGGCIIVIFMSMIDCLKRIINLKKEFFQMFFFALSL
jgi:hypothetical protein